MEGETCETCGRPPGDGRGRCRKAAWEGMCPPDDGAMASCLYHALARAEDERDTLRAEVERLRALDEARCSEIQRLIGITSQGARDFSSLRVELSAALARAEKAEAERDRAHALVDEAYGIIGEYVPAMTVWLDSAADYLENCHAGCAPETQGGDHE